MTFRTKLRRFLRPKSLAGKATLAAAGFVGVLVVVYLVALYYTGRRLEEARRAGDRFGLPNDVAALFGGEVEEARNAAVPIDAAATIAAEFLEKERKKGWWAQDPDWLEDVRFVIATDELRRNEAYEKALAEADRRTEYRSLAPARPPYFLANAKSLEPRRDVIRVERPIAWRLAAKGKTDEAIQRLLRVMRLTRRWEDKELLSSAPIPGPMLNMAIRCLAIEGLNDILRRGKHLPSGLHDEIEHEAAHLESAPELHRLMLHVRKLTSDEAYDRENPLAKVRLLRPVLNNDRAYMHQFFHRMMDSTSKPLASGDEESLERELKRTKGHPVEGPLHVGTCLLTPGAFQFRAPFDRALALARSLRVVNALVRKGDDGIELEALGLQKEALVDPYDGKRIRIKQTARGVIVYTIGPNLTDDGGALLNLLDVGLGPPGGEKE